MAPLPAGYRENCAERIDLPDLPNILYIHSHDTGRWVRTHRWKYILRFGERTRPVLPNTDDGPSKELLLTYG
jgi:hypothetical protein